LAAKSEIGYNLSTLLWQQQHYFSVAMPLQCHCLGVTLLWQWYCSDVVMTVHCKEQQEQKRLMRTIEWWQFVAFPATQQVVM